MEATERSILAQAAHDPLLRATSLELTRFRLVLADLDRTITGSKADRHSPLGAIWTKVERLNQLTRQMGFEHPLLSMTTVCLWPPRPGLNKSDTFCYIVLFNRSAQSSEEALFRGDESPAQNLEFRNRVLEALRSWITDIDIRLTELRASSMDAVTASPYPPGTDVRFLWGWAYRMDCYIRSGLSLSQWSAALVLPDQRTAEAMNRQSIKYPAIIRQIQDHLDVARRFLDQIDETEAAQDDLREAMRVLMERIYSGAATIAQAESEENSDESATSASVTNPTASGMSCEEATERLLTLRSQGLPYTSQGRLAQDLGCSSSTLNKAIQNSPLLQSWMQQTRQPRGAPKATSLSPALLRRTSAVEVEDPTDLLPPEDEQKILDRLISEHGDDMRRQIDSLDPDARRKFAATCEEQRLDAEESPLAPRVSGRRRTKTRVHKRV